MLVHKGKEDGILRDGNKHSRNHKQMLQIIDTDVKNQKKPQRSMNSLIRKCSKR